MTKNNKVLLAGVVYVCLVLGIMGSLFQVSIWSAFSQTYWPAWLELGGAIAFFGAPFYCAWIVYFLVAKLPEKMQKRD